MCDSLFADLRESISHRSSNLQVSEHESGNIVISGFFQLSANCIVDIAAKHERTLSVWPVSATPASLQVIVHPRDKRLPNEDINKLLAIPTTKVSCSSSVTKVFPFSDSINSDTLQAYLRQQTAVELILRPTTITAISVVQNSTKGSLWECVQKRHRRQHVLGSNRTSRSQMMKTTKTMKNLKAWLYRYLCCVRLATHLSCKHLF